MCAWATRNWPSADLRGGRKTASIRAATANCFCNTYRKPTKDATLIFSKALHRSPNRRSTELKVSGAKQGLVRKEGVEPPRPFGHKILSLARLPVPPLPQGGQQIHYICNICSRLAWPIMWRMEGRWVFQLYRRIRVRSRRGGVHAN